MGGAEGTPSTPPLPGAPWGTDLLELPPPKGLASPYPLDIPWGTVLQGSPTLLRPLSTAAGEPSSARIEAALAKRGFVKVTTVPMSSSRFTGPGPESAPGFVVPSTLFLAERNLRVDKTRYRNTRRRSRYLWFVGGASIFAFIAYLTLEPSVPHRVVPLLFVPALIPIIIGLGSLQNVDFWSEFVYVVTGTRHSAGPGPPEQASPSRLSAIQVWAGVVRSENWTAKAGAGRAFKQVVASDSLSRGLPDLIEAILSEEAATPLRES